jgi:hypothetical protein
MSTPLAARDVVSPCIVLVLLGGGKDCQFLVVSMLIASEQGQMGDERVARGVNLGSMDKRVESIARSKTE